MPEKLTRPAASARAKARAKTRRLSAALRAGGIDGYAHQARLSFFLPAPPATAAPAAEAKVPVRLSREQRDAELNRARDVSASVNGLEELFLTARNISFEEISRAVLGEACRLTGSRFGLAGYADPSTGRFMAATLAGKAEKPRRAKKNAFITPEFNGLCSRVLRGKKPLLTNFAASPRTAAGRSRGDGGVPKFLGVPVLAGRKLLGLLALAEPRGDYSAVELKIAGQMARAYAIILTRKLAEEGRRKEHDALLAIISSSQDIIYSADMDGVIVYASPRVSAYGYRPKELLGRSIFELVHPQDREIAVKALAKAKETGRPMPTISYRLRKRNGGYFFMEQKSGIVKSGGKAALITGVVRNIGGRLSAAAVLKENEATFRNIFEAAGDAIFIKDLLGRYLKVNKACVNYFRLTKKGVLGRTDAEIFPGEEALASTRGDREVIRTGKTIVRTYDRELPTGKLCFNVVKTPLRNADGEIIGVLGAARDITGVKETEAELAAARAAEALGKVARPMAHDFNNALAVINGYATLIDEETAVSSPIKAGLEHIISAVKWAAELTSQFQTFARDPKPETGNGNTRK